MEVPIKVSFFFFFFSWLGISGVAVLVESQPGFVSIDCGYTGDSYKDTDTGIIYDPDVKYIDTGENHNISPNYTGGRPKQAWDLRSFPNGTRNCYTINDVNQGYKYLIRASFLYGDYDGQKKAWAGTSYFTFDLCLGVNLWQTMNITHSSMSYSAEIISIASSNYFSICLVRTGDGIPFISALELRLINSDVVYKDVNQTVSLLLLERYNMGSLNLRPIRYPDDKYDRIWMPCNYDKQCWRYNVNYINTKAQVQMNPGDEYEVPSNVMQTAATAEDDNTLTYYLAAENTASIPLVYHIYLHFADLIYLQNNGSRIFQLRMVREPDGVLFSPTYLKATHIHQVYAVQGADPNTYFNLTLVAGSTLPPILNADEIYTAVNLRELPTNPGDVEAMMELKKLYSIIPWQGDPCSPQQFAWTKVNCTYTESSPPTVASLNLSHYKLNGSIPTALTGLSAIKYLDLSNNNFIGPIPSFLADLSYLHMLDLSNNQLSGYVPNALCDRLADGSLELRVDNNQDLNKYGPSGEICESPRSENKGKKLSTLLVVVISMLITAGILLAIFVAFFLRRRKPTRLPQPAHPSKIKPKEGKYIESSSFATKAHQFTYQDLKTITNNFDQVIGKGGFGTVYYGYLCDGTEVAVKMQRRSLTVVKVMTEEFRSEESDSNSHAHATKEFQAEALLLSRIHHRNLVSLVGYCKDTCTPGLVFEYAAQGNLQDHLSGKASGGKLLIWRKRLNIAVDTAQGLEYLHKGCKPPIIHRDVKTSNILLSHNFEAKISDFGLSKAFLTDAQTHVSTKAVAGTPGYVDPEYHNTFRLNEKSDVYSFGVVLLELITGLPAVLKFPEIGHIVQWVRQGLAEGDIADVVDSRLNGQYGGYSIRKVVDVALDCTAAVANQRPTMSEVVMQLKESLQLEIAREVNMNGGVEAPGMSPSETTEMALTPMTIDSSGPVAR